MSSDKEQIFKQLSDAVVEMDEEAAVVLARRVIELRIDAFEAIDQGLAHGMERAGKLFEDEEYFVSELLMCSDAMYAGIGVLEPHLKKENARQRHKVVLGVIEGDTHDIGKNLVKLMLDSGGFEVVDLGRDVPPHRFVEEAKACDARIIAVSNLMTTTMNSIGIVMNLLEQEGIRGQFKVMVGGRPISQGFADKVGADGYSANAAEAVRVARKLVSAG